MSSLALLELIKELLYVLKFSSLRFVNFDSTIIKVIMFHYLSIGYKYHFLLSFFLFSRLLDGTPCTVTIVSEAGGAWIV